MYISNAQILFVVLGQKIGVKWKSQVSSLKTKPKKKTVMAAVKSIKVVKVVKIYPH